MRFQTGAGRTRPFQDEEYVLNFEEKPTPGKAGGGRIFLERWKRRASYRRAKAARELLTAPLSPQRTEQLIMWLRNLEARKAWLVARLEDNLGLESILRAAIDPQRSSRRHDVAGSGRVATHGSAG